MIKLKKAFGRIGCFLLAVMLVGCFFGCTPGVNFSEKRQQIDMYPFSIFYFDETGDMTYAEAKEIHRSGGFEQMTSLAGYKNPGVFWVFLSVNPTDLVQSPTTGSESNDLPCDLCGEKEADAGLVDPNACGLCLITHTNNKFEIEPTFRVIDAYYTTPSGAIIHRKTGAHANTTTTTKGWNFSHGCFPIDDYCPEKEQINLYLRLVMMYGYNPGFQGSITSYRQEHLRWASRFSQIPLLIGFRLMVIAIIFYIFLFSLIQYSLLKDNAYLFYALYIFLFLLFVAEQLFMGDSVLYNTLFSVREWHFYFEVPLAVSMYISYMWFLVVFLDLSASNSKAYFWIKIGIGFSISLIIVDIITRHIGGVYLSMRWYSFDRIPLFLIGLVFFYYIFKGEKRPDADEEIPDTQKRLAIIIIIGSALLLFGGLMGSLIMKYYLKDLIAEDQWNQNNPFYYPGTYMQLGFLAENIVLLFGLGYRAQVQFAELKERISTQTRKIESLSDSIESTVEFRFIAHTLKNIRQCLLGLSSNRQKIAAEYYDKMIELVEKWYKQSQTGQTHSLKQELADMQTWIKLNNLILSPPIQVKVEGIELLEEDFPISVVGMLLPFVENCIIHGFHKQQKASGPRILAFNIQEDNEQGCYLIYIEDNGVGFDKTVGGVEGKPESTGMELAKKRLTKIGGKIHSIRDLQEEGLAGTRIVLSVPNA